MGQKRILVIDDNRMLAMTAERVLQKSGYETASALGGLEGLEKVRQWRPDLIILDIVMPDMDGYEVACRLKQFAAGIPIIFLSSKGNTDETSGAPTTGLKEIDKAFNCGANDFLHKPVAAADLLQAVKNVFGLYELIT